MIEKDKFELTVEFCPFCRKEHEVTKYFKKDSVEIKGDMVEYMAEGYTCPITKCEEGNSWANGKVSDENLLRARDAYRIKNNLLTSSEIVAIVLRWRAFRSCRA